ncbi:LysR family transcriptional regulator [Lichenicoccus sp.]|uniref:LysR family transcriptional regulator n=1 Tax=Lichenicoccus sp. TaxID=2781899 RepID=UPI003D126CB4
MDLRGLMFYRSVVELGTISKAAAYLRIAQPALSRQIQKLEHAVGVKLLQRTSKGVMPTAAGVLLLERTARLEAELADISREVAGTVQEVGGPLHVAVQAPFSTMLIPDLVKAYLAEHPGVALHLVDGYSADVIDALLDERLDVAITDAPSHKSSTLTVTPLWTDSLQLFGPGAAAGTGLFQVAPAPLAEVAKLPLILPTARYTIRRLVDAAFAHEQLKASLILEADGPAMISAMVSRGLGFTLMPAFGTAAQINRNKVCIVETMPSIDRPVSIVTRTAVQNERKVTTFARLFKAAALDLMEREQPKSVRFNYSDTSQLATGSRASLSLVSSNIKPARR